VDHPAGMLLSAPLSLDYQSGCSIFRLVSTWEHMETHGNLSIFFRNAKVVWIVKRRCMHDNTRLTHLEKVQSDESRGHNDKILNYWITIYFFAVGPNKQKLRITFFF
jgi:hypothetical protein